MNKKVSNQAELRDAVLENAQKNHIWVNAFSIINPSDEVLKNIGKSVVDMLKQKQPLLPNYYGPEMDGEITDLQKITPVLYMSINAS